MELELAVGTRRSVGRVGPEAPTDAEVLEVLALAAGAPDHGGLRPWRFVSIRGAARDALGRAFAEVSGDEQQARRAREKPLRAPLLLGIVHCPRPHPGVPAWEQLAATSGVVTTLGLLLHGRGWATMWRSGPFVEAPAVHRMMGVTPEEQLLGWLYVGRCAPDDAPKPRRLLSAEDLARRLRVMAAEPVT
ncbi:MAG TPA: nitroreductase [Pseudonocardiaceae bacterium]|nr:nitroreductase [Pseudonocardiaceae bacterium]